MSAEDKDKPKSFDDVIKPIKKEDTTTNVQPGEIIEGVTGEAAEEIKKTKSQLEKDFWKAFNKLASQDEYEINGTYWVRRPITKKENMEIQKLLKELGKIDKEVDSEVYMDLEYSTYQKFAHYCLKRKDTGEQMTPNEFDNSENEILQRVLDAIFYKLEAGLPFVQRTSKSY